VRKFLLAAALALPSLPAVADALHGVVCGPGGTGCINTDNNNFAPIPGGVSTNWGFEISPGPQTGDLILAVLVPTNTT
jgi:hypothetical protein